MRYLSGAILATVAACGAPVPVIEPSPSPQVVVVSPPPISEEGQAALATVQRLFDAMRTRDTAAMRQIFDPGARLYGIRLRRDSSVTVQAISGSDFINAVASSAGGPVWNERMFSPEVRVSETLATVWTEYDFHAGSQFSHCGVNAVQLLKVGERWRIVSISDTRVRTGCPTRPAP
jgi:hypothetical protein